MPATSGLLAPAWHTRALVAFLLAVALTGSLLEPAALRPVGVRSLMLHGYLPLVLANALLCAYVSGVGLPRNVFAELLGRFRGGRGLLVDAGVGLGLALALVVAESSLQLLLGLPESAAAHALLPHSVTERLLWLPVAALVAFSEELVYRGYLQRQLTTLSGRLSFGVLAQAALFGIAHGEQGAWAVARFAVYALAFGWVAARRASLLPGILAHTTVNWVAALDG